MPRADGAACALRLVSLALVLVLVGEVRQLASVLWLLASRLAFLPD